MPHRSPIIFWLLLAATISVDAAAYIWLVSIGPIISVRSSDANLLFDALLMAQVGITCAWSALSAAKTIWVRVVPWLAVFVAVASKVFAAASTTNLTLPQSISSWSLHFFLPEYLLCAALLMLVLWLFERTPFWRNRSRVKREWQFSIGQLLIVMTVVAVLIITIRNDSMLIGDDYGIWLSWAWACSAVLLVLAASICWTLSWHWLLRLALVQAAALALGLFFGYYSGGDLAFHVERQIAYYTIQALVLSAWLGLGTILPTSTTSDAAAKL